MSSPRRPSEPANPNALTPDEIEAIIPTFVATRADVAIAEQANIEAASRWAFGRRRVVEPDELLTVEFADELHRRMFGDVWKWAGEHSPVRTATGVMPDRIQPRLESAFKDARFWHDNGLDTPSSRAIRIHDALAKIHPYRSGNRRHARFLADLYLHLLDEPRLTWHLDDDDTAPAGANRRADLTALQQALDRATAEIRQRRSPNQP